MAVIDIYQSLSAKRSYKEAMSKEEISSIMMKMVKEGKIDGAITADVLKAEAR